MINWAGCTKRCLKLVLSYNWYCVTNIEITMTAHNIEIIMRERTHVVEKFTVED